jgi:hypothetical protein
MSSASRVRWFPAARAAAAAVAVPVALLIGCGGAPRGGGTGAAGAVAPGAPANPGACGEAATSTELGRRMHVFLAATVALETEIAATETALRSACGVMSRDLGLARTRAAATLAVCSAVARELHHVHARPEQPGQPPKQPDDTAQPAGATTATGAATTASGTPAPAAGDDARLDAALRVTGAHLPRIARLRTRVAGSLQAELRDWGRTAADLVAAGPEPLQPLGSHAACMFDQLVIAAARLAVMQASLTAQLEASTAIQAAARIPVG